MSIIIDLIILGIIGICIFLGYKRGLVKCIIKIASFIIAIVLAFVLYKPVSGLIIDNTEIDENIKQAIINSVQKDVQEDGKVKEDSNLPQSIVDYINESVGSAVEETKNNIVETSATQISTIAIEVGTGILIFILARLILMIISILSKFVTDLPIIKQVDKTGGIIYGILKAALIIFIIFAIISLISPMIEETGLIVGINNSIIGSILYNNNLLLSIAL